MGPSWAGASVLMGEGFQKISWDGGCTTMPPLLWENLAPLYEQLLWDYKKAHNDNIKTSTESVNWVFLLNDKNVNRQDNL